MDASCEPYRLIKVVNAALFIGQRPKKDADICSASVLRHSQIIDCFDCCCYEPETIYEGAESKSATKAATDRSETKQEFHIAKELLETPYPHQKSRTRRG